jgi:hypothetical protein
MLTTQDIQLGSGGSGKTPKTIKPGNTTAKVLEITLQPLKNDPEAFYLIFNLEGEDQGPDFEGFMYDKDNPNKGRAKGQVGKLRYSLYPYRNGVTKAGKPRDRNTELLRSLVEFAEVAGKRTELNNIKAQTIEDFVSQASKILSGDQFYYWCIGGSAYIKQDGNKDFTLSLPKYDRNFKNYELAGTSPSTVAVFNYASHVEDKTEAAKEETSGWGAPAITPVEEKGAWKPSGFDI